MKRYRAWGLMNAVGQNLGLHVVLCTLPFNKYRSIQRVGWACPIFLGWVYLGSGCYWGVGAPPLATLNLYLRVRGV
jgi:hypothetical protein